jgi:hypothetical protein
MHLFWPTIQKGGHMLQPLREKSFLLISNVFGKGRAPIYSHLLPLTKSNKNPTKTWKQNHKKKSSYITTQGIKR